MYDRVKGTYTNKTDIYPKRSEHTNSNSPVSAVKAWPSTEAVRLKPAGKPKTGQACSQLVY